MRKPTQSVFDLGGTILGFLCVKYPQSLSKGAFSFSCGLKFGEKYNSFLDIAITDSRGRTYYLIKIKAYFFSTGEFISYDAEYTEMLDTLTSNSGCASWITSLLNLLLK